MSTETHLVAKKVAHDENGELSIALIDGRAFVHGSLLDRGSAEIMRLLDRINQLETALKCAPSARLLTSEHTSNFRVAYFHWWEVERATALPEAPP